MILTVDGGPDENPRYQKTINCAIDYFSSYDLDAFFLATNAPGRSAFNRVERRMAKLSHELSGVVLDHQHFGTHLDSQKNTIDDELELKNFEHAGTVLAEIWSRMEINKHPTVAEFISCDASEELVQKSEEWKAEHVRESQYFLQIMKCCKPECCKPFRSSLLRTMGDRFLPSPLPVMQTPNGLKWASCDKRATYLPLLQNIHIRKSLPSPSQPRAQSLLPYDYSCPSITTEDSKKRTCKHCSLYHSTITSNVAHERVCKKESTNPQSISSNKNDTLNPNPTRIRPVRIAAKRQREVLCAMAMQELEWHNIDEVEMDNTDMQNVPDVAIAKSGTPIFDVPFSSVWSEDMD